MSSIVIKKGYLKPRCGIHRAANLRKAGPMSDKRKEHIDFDDCNQCHDGSGVYYLNGIEQECICVETNV